MEENNVVQKESIKLTKNAKGEYQWEIKILSMPECPLANNELDRLEEVNNKLEEKYGRGDTRSKVATT